MVMGIGAQTDDIKWFCVFAQPQNATGVITDWDSSAGCRP